VGQVFPYGGHPQVGIHSDGEALALQGF
jgi:hypothetical protein